MSFEYSRLRDGRDRWMAQQDDVLIEVIGPERNLEKATMIIAFEDPMYVALMATFFFQVSVPGWEEEGVIWLGDNSMEAVDSAVATSVGRKLVGMEVSSIMGSLTLTVEAR